jgi:Domain of unknown function (DUF4388)
MALEGTLEDFSLADIFQLIGIQRKTGILSLKNSDEAVTITFHNGMVIGADSSPRKLEDRLGKVLVKTGLISQQQLTEALQRQQKTLQKIGYILVNEKYISRDQLKEALQIQVAQMIYRLFRWKSGEYYFDQKARVDPNADETIPPVSAESILMEGIQMIDEWPVIQKRIPNFGLIFRPTVQMEDLEIAPETEDDNFEPIFVEGEPNGDSEKVKLSRDEAEVFRMVDSRNSVAEIIESTRLGEFHTCKALYDLLDRKIIEEVPPAPPTYQFQASELPLQIALEKERNYTLAYPVLAVLVLVFAIFSYSDPMKLPFYHFFQDQDSENLNKGISGTRIALIDSAIVTYFYANGELPETLQDLTTSHYLGSESLFDPWQKSYGYQVNGTGYVLTGYNSQGSMDPALTVHRVLNPQPEKHTLHR